MSPYHITPLAWKAQPVTEDWPWWRTSSKSDSPPKEVWEM